jgi:hypothetical protein
MNVATRCRLRRKKFVFCWGGSFIEKVSTTKRADIVQLWRVGKLVHSIKLREKWRASQTG